MVEKINIIKLILKMKSNYKRIFGIIGKIRKNNGYKIGNDLWDCSSSSLLSVSITLAYLRRNIFYRRK